MSSSHAKKNNLLEAELFADLLIQERPANEDLLVKIHEEDVDMDDIFIVEEDIVAEPLLAANEERFVIASENMFEGGPLGLPGEGDFHDAVENWGHALINEVRKKK